MSPNHDDDLKEPSGPIGPKHEGLSATYTTRVGPSEDSPQPDQSEPSTEVGGVVTRKRLRLRSGLAILIALLVTAYTAGVISGQIKDNNKISAVDLAVIGLGGIGILLLVSPDSFKRLTHFELGSLKFDIEQVKASQLRQEYRLEDIALILPLLLPEKERVHLQKLEMGATADYKGSHGLRTELRHLRSIGLIRMRDPKLHVGEITDGRQVDLKEYIVLTDLGARWVRRIKEFDREEIDG